MAKSKIVGIAALDKELANIINDYTRALAGNVDKAALKITQELVQDIKNNARSQGLHLTGDYIKGWTYKKVKDIYVVHNRTDYQLVHLLEKPHAKRNGELKRAYPHVRPAQLVAVKKFEAAVRKAAERS